MAGFYEKVRNNLIPYNRKYLNQRKECKIYSHPKDIFTVFSKGKSTVPFITFLSYEMFLHFSAPTVHSEISTYSYVTYLYAKVYYVCKLDIHVSVHHDIIYEND